MQHRVLVGAIAVLLPLSVPAVAQQAAAPAAPAPVVTTAAPPHDDPGQRIVCRRMEVTGSLARRDRVCKTAAEWQRLGDRGNELARDMVDWGRARTPGN